jgi:hypothetical protein
MAEQSRREQLVINTAAGNNMMPPGQYAIVSSYMSPNGESTGWYCDGSYWWCI